MGTLQRRMTQVGADRRLDVPEARRAVLQWRQGHGPDDHHAWPAQRDPRVHLVRYLDTPDGFVVWGTGSGSPKDPDWFRNLRLAPTADVQVKAEHLQVRPRELVGQERANVWMDVVLAQAPEVAKYARKARRTIPVAVLQPVEGRHDG